MVIKRDLYLDKLKKAMHNGRIKIITGIRRCGKSFLLFNLFKEHLLSEGVAQEQIIEIALDRQEFVGLRNPVALYEYVKSRINPHAEFYLLKLRKPMKSLYLRRTETFYTPRFTMYSATL